MSDGTDFMLRDLLSALTAERARADVTKLALEEARARISTLEAELKAATEWRDVDTAPKYRSLLIYDGGYEIGHFNAIAGYWLWNSSRQYKQAPAFWLPLPTPPGGAHGTG